jgi:hypothetical protein
MLNSGKKIALCAYRQGNEQKQVEYTKFKIPINQDTKFQFQNIYILSNGFPHLFGATFLLKMTETRFARQKK